MLSLNKIKNITLGIIIGLSIASTHTFAQDIKEYILSKVKYPIIVNGVEYVNDELPILNWNGNTYVPLRAVGDILDAKVEWNDELKRVEIGEFIILDGKAKLKDFLEKPIDYDNLTIENNGKIIFVNNEKYYESNYADMILYKKGNYSGWKMETSQYDYIILKDSLTGLYDTEHSYTIPNEELVFYQNSSYLPSNIIDNIKFN